MYLTLAVSLYLIASGLYALWQAEAIATRNRRLIESGREAWFEQRRAWRAYGTTPPASTHEVRRRAWRSIALGVLLPLAAMAFRWLNPHLGLTVFARRHACGAVSCG